MKNPPPRKERPHVSRRLASWSGEPDLPPVDLNAPLAVKMAAMRERQALMRARAERDDRWRGFQAADAAAQWDDVTDKRGNKNNPLVALDCPFLDEHATSNKPGTRQLAIYNAGTPDQIPTCKCQADTCRGRPYTDFLEALFNDETRLNPLYRS